MTRRNEMSNMGLYQVKQEDQDEEKLNAMFVGEPVPPPPLVQALNAFRKYYEVITMIDIC